LNALDASNRNAPLEGFKAALPKKAALAADRKMSNPEKADSLSSRGKTHFRIAGI